MKCVAIVLFFWARRNSCAQNQPASLTAAGFFAFGAIMRLSVNPGDRGYKAFRGLPRNVTPLVFLDGKEVHGCVTVDTKRGHVLAFDRDEKGDIKVNSKRGVARMARLYGKVEVVMRRDASRHA